MATEKILRLIPPDEPAIIKVRFYRERKGELEEIGEFQTDTDDLESIPDITIRAEVELTGCFHDDGTPEAALNHDGSFDRALAQLGNGEIEISFRKVG